MRRVFTAILIAVAALVFTINGVAGDGQKAKSDKTKTVKTKTKTVKSTCPSKTISKDGADNAVVESGCCSEADVVIGKNKLKSAKNGKKGVTVSQKYKNCGAQGDCTGHKKSVKKKRPATYEKKTTEKLEVKNAR